MEKMKYNGPSAEAEEMNSQKKEFVGLVSSMTTEQKDDFLELLLLIGHNEECMDAAIAWMRENGSAGVHDYVCQFKQNCNAGSTRTNMIER